MLRYKLRTLLILLAILPPLLWLGWTKYAAWKAEKARREALLNQQLSAPQGPIYVIETTGVPQVVLPPGTQINTIPMPSTPAPTPARAPFQLIPPAPLKRP